MRRTKIPTMILSTALASFLGAPGGTAQNESLAEIPSQLEEKLEIALQSSPSIQMAEARLRQVEAEFREVRLRVTQEVIQKHNAYAVQRQQIHSAEREMQRIIALQQNNMVPDAERMNAETHLIAEHNQLAQIEAELRYLLGMDSYPFPRRGVFEAPHQSAQMTRPARPPVPPLLEEMLSTLIDVQYDGTPLPEVVTSLASQLARQGIPHSIVMNEAAIMEWEDPSEIRFHLRLHQKVPLRQALLAITDQTDICFVVRDYGILVTSVFQGERMYAAAIPADLALDDAAVPAER